MLIKIKDQLSHGRIDKRQGYMVQMANKTVDGMLNWYHFLKGNLATSNKY